MASSAGGFWFAAFWGAGILVCTVRIAISYLCLGRIRRSATPAPRLGERVFTSPLVPVPIAAGLWHPVVIVPNDLFDTLAPRDLEAIIAHERAHIARNDIFGNVVQRLVESLLFFNPWVYVIGRQLVKEREAACDDWAVRAEVILTDLPLVSRRWHCAVHASKRLYSLQARSGRSEYWSVASRVCSMERPFK